MRVRVIILFFLLLNYSVGFAQFFAERLAIRHLEKGRWDRAFVQLGKMIRKDSANAVAEYLLSRYFLDGRCPSFHIDSANKYLKKANRIFQNAPQKARDKWSRWNLDSLVLLRSRNKLDSMAFARASSSNTVTGYAFFLKEFPDAKQRPEALHLQQEAAFDDTKKTNTYQAFFEYMKLYPEAKRYAEARQEYERLLYEAKTADQKLKSYKHFVHEYGNSPYRHQAELNIMVRQTAIGTPESFRSFFRNYPNGPASRRAEAIWFHLLTEDEQSDYVNELSDSLRRIANSSPIYMVPVLHQQEILFLNQNGEQLLTVPNSSLPEYYWCGNLQEELIVLADKIISRLGKVVYAGKVYSLDDVGKGFMLLDKGNCKLVMHKSGFVVDDGVDETRIICASFLAMKKQGKWGIWSFAGVQLQPYKWDDIHGFDNVIVLELNAKFALVTKYRLASVADQQPLGRLEMYDEVKKWKHELIWVRSAVYEGVLDQNLTIYIHFEKHQLNQTHLGITAALDSRTTFYVGNKPLGTFTEITEQAQWLAAKQMHWQLFKPTDAFVSRQYDSISFTGPFALGYYADSVDVHGMNGNRLSLKGQVRAEFLAGQDSVFFLLIEHEQKKTLFTQALEKLMAVSFDHIQYAGERFFIISKREKKGLLNIEGKLVLPVEFDAIGAVKDGHVSVLRAMRFGLADIRNNRFIKPEYNKNPWVYPSQGIVVFKQNKYGFIDWDNKPKSSFVFDEIQYWNDTTALVKKDNRWHLYEIFSRQMLIENISDFTNIRSSTADKLMIVHQEDSYGVLHSQKGVIIPISFSDVVNLGTDELPFFFTEKHVEEASLYVVIYYDFEGRMIRKEVYEPPVYEEIYCSESGN